MCSCSRLREVIGGQQAEHGEGCFFGRPVSNPQVFGLRGQSGYNGSGLTGNGPGQLDLFRSTRVNEASDRLIETGAGRLENRETTDLCFSVCGGDLGTGGRCGDQYGQMECAAR